MLRNRYDTRIRTVEWILNGAKIHEVRRKVEKRENNIENGLLIIQGVGNYFENIGTEETLTEVVEAVKVMEGKNVSLAVVGVMRQSRENGLRGSG